MKTIAQTPEFSFDRFLQLCKRYFALYRRIWLVGFAGLAGFPIVVWLVTNTLGEPSHNFTIMLFTVSFFFFHLGGYVLASDMFKELNSVGSASRMFTLPATTFEKIFSAWFLSYFCYTILAGVTLYLICLILGFAEALFVETAPSQYTGVPGINIFNHLLTYTLYHSVFLLGATYFRNNNFLKTALSILLFFTFLGLILFSLMHVFALGESSNGNMSSELHLYFGIHADTITVFFKIALTFLFLFFSYIRLKNRQVA